MINNDTKGLIQITSDLMPKGEPNFKEIKFYPTINQIIESNGKKDIRKVILALLKNYCDSCNLPEGKNMNAVQMLECACFLLDECDNFRLEDYVMMFAMAKRGKLKIGDTGRVFDRVDIQLISEFKENYEAIRREAGYKLQMKEVEEKEMSNQNNNMAIDIDSEQKKKQNFDTAMELFKGLVQKHKEEQQQARIELENEYEKRKRKLLQRQIENANECGDTLLANHLKTEFENLFNEQID